MAILDTSKTSSSSSEPWFEGSSWLLEAIIHSSDDAIITKDLDGIVISWNPAATRIFGYMPEEMVDRSILQIIPLRLHHEETEILRKLRAGEQIAHFETTRLRKDNREIIVSLTISPVRNEQGEVVGVSKIARDITDRKQSDIARFRLAAIVESADDAIISKDLNGIITSWNRAAERIFGYSEEEIIGTSILILIPDELLQEEKTIIEKIRKGEKIEHYETIRLTKDGRRLEVSLTISPLRDFSGTIVGASKILRDITERKRLEQAVIQAGKLAANSKMAATIAHEINNPLEAVLNLIYLAQSSSSNPEVKAFLKTAESELERLSHISKLSLGFYREKKSASNISLSELVTDALGIYGSKLKSSHIQVQTRFTSSRQILAKKGELMQVISNLITNAMYAMPSGGTLTAAVEDASMDGRDALLLSIEDNGIGIPSKNLQKIFEPFFTTRDSIGTGIGLWIAKQFIEGHSGKIEVKSSTDAMLHGTKILITLPFENSYAEEQTA